MSYQTITESQAIQDFDFLYNPLPALPEKQSCYIYGAGNLGQIVLKVLKNHKYLPIGFIDKNANRQVNGLPVLSIEDDTLDKTSPVFIAVYNHSREAESWCILNHLKQNGFDTIVSYYQLVNHYFDELNYYNSLYLQVGYNYYQENIQKIVKAYLLLADEHSRTLFRNQILARTGQDLIEYPVDYDNPYFPCELKEYISSRKFMDIGACDGDTLQEILNRGILLDKYWGFEPDPNNFLQLQSKSLQVEQAELFMEGVGDKTCILQFNSGRGASCEFSENGDISVPIVAIDDAHPNIKPDYVKMDIEGFEKQAIVGMQKMIRRDRPQLAVCVYHLPDDIFSILLLIEDLATENNYRYYLRCHASNQRETVLYAL